MFDSNLIQKSNLLFQLASKFNIKIAVAESCTAGLVAALITEVSGSSAIFERGFITYSDLAKEQLLNIDSNIINISTDLNTNKMIKSKNIKNILDI